MTQDTQVSRFEALPEQVQSDLHLVMYWSEHYGTQAEANAVERLTDYFAQDIETVAESADLAALRQRVQELDEIRDAIGLCAAAVVLAYYRKTHDHILVDNDAIDAALKVEHWLGRR